MATEVFDTCKETLRYAVSASYTEGDEDQVPQECLIHDRKGEDCD